MSLVMVNHGRVPPGGTAHDTACPIEPGSVIQYRWVFQATLPLLQTGDVLVVQAENEFTNPVSYNVGLFTAVTLTNSAPWYDEDLFGNHATPTAGMFVSEIAGCDFDSARHHELHSRNG